MYVTANMVKANPNIPAIEPARPDPNANALTIAPAADETNITVAALEVAVLNCAPGRFAVVSQDQAITAANRISPTPMEPADLNCVALEITDAIPNRRPCNHS